MPTATMAKKKRTEPTPEPTAVKPTSFRPAADIAAAMEAFRKTYGEYPPAYSQIIDRALRMYLRSKGFTELSETPDD